MSGLTLKQNVNGQGTPEPDPSAIQQLIRRTRAMLRSSWVLTGVCISVGSLLAAAWVVSLTDLALALQPWSRFIGLMLIVLPFLGAFVLGVMKPLFRRLTSVMIARRIEREIPGIRNRLVSCVDLAQQRRAALHSSAFHRRLITEALHWIRGFKPSHVLDLVSMRRAGTFAASSFLAIVLTFVVFSDRLSIAMARILQPFADIPPASHVLFDVLVDDRTAPGDHITLRRQDVKFTVVLKRGELEAGDGNALRLAIRALDDRGNERPLNYEFSPLQDNRASFTLTGMDHSFRYRVFGGGTWTKEYRVTMIDRPRIVGLQTVLHYPEYMKMETPRPGVADSADVTGPRESTVELQLEVAGDATEGEIQLLQEVASSATAVESPQTKDNTSEFEVVESFFLSPLGTDASTKVNVESEGNRETPTRKWSGRFPLLRDGFYRVVMRNELGHPNPPMQEGKLIATPDEPPQVVLEKPGVDLVVSKPIKVPLFVSAYDDFGLDQITLSVQHGDSGGFRGRPIRRFEKPERHAADSLSIDMAAENLKIGDTLRYRIEARDSYGQTAATRDFSIRLAAEPSAADHQFAAFEQSTKAVQQKLAQLVNQQAKVQQSISQLTERFQPLTEKIEKAQAEAQQKLAEAKTDPAQPQLAPAVQLDAAALEQLAKLRSEAAQIAQAEKQNVQLGQQVATEMKQLAEQSTQVALLPSQIAQHIVETQQAFQEVAQSQLPELANRVEQLTKPEQMNPELPTLKQDGGEVQENLEALQARLDAIALAETASAEDVEQSLVDLRNNLLKQTARETASDLSGLREYLEKLRAQLEEVESDQKGLMHENLRKVSDQQFEKLLGQQKQVDARANPELTAARRLLEQLEATSAENERNAAEQDEGGDSPEPRPFVPALGGEMPPADQQLAEQRKAIEARRSEPKRSAEDRQRDDVQVHQVVQADQLDTAERALRADQNSIDQLLKALHPATGQELTAEQLANLAGLLTSRQLDEARAMRERLENLQRSTHSRTNTDASSSTRQSLSANRGNIRSLTPDDSVSNVDAILIEVGDLDLDARTMILKMQPQTREELLQGLREEGPEGYREFIRDYFRRLSKVQSPPK